MTGCGCGWIKTPLLVALSVLGVVLSGLPLQAQMRDARELAEATVVIYNSEDPVSRDLATFYGQRRSIPAGHVMGLSMPTEEEISRADYVAQIERPLRREFFRNGWWKLEGEEITQSSIRFVVLMKGVPLKIAPGYSGDQISDEQKKNPMSYRDEASVDSELAAMGFLAAPDAGALRNFYHRSFRPIAEAGIPPLLLVTRLDAPTPGAVMNMITGALHAEENGLYGWAAVDWRGVGGGYKQGDDWLKAIGKDLQQAHRPAIIDPHGRVLSEFPFHNLALYFGWYTGTVTPTFLVQNEQVFRPGAIAVHIHSFSASTMRRTNAGWAGPLLESGAAVTLGNVYEPYLGLTHHLDVFYDRLKNGMTVAEAAYSSVPVLSWMWVVLGDPLYRPYKVQEDLLSDPNLSGDDFLWSRSLEYYRDHLMDDPGASDKLWQIQKEYPKSSIPILVHAEALLQKDQHQQAAELLEISWRWMDTAAARAHALRMLVRAEAALGHHEIVEDLLLKEYATNPENLYLENLRQLAVEQKVALPEPEAEPELVEGI